MNKIVVYQSAEFYELQALGWVVVGSAGGNMVEMSQIGTAYVSQGGKPETSADPTKWTPYWLGRGIPGVPQSIVGPTWTEISHTSLPPDIVGPLTIFLDQNASDPTTGRVAIRRNVFDSVLYYRIWTPYADAVTDYHTRGGIGP